MSFRLMMIVGALLAGVTLPATAEAASMRTTTDLNMRASPGGSRITVIPGGAWVEVIGYSGGWCRVAWAGYDGWASCRYLASAVPDGRYYYPDPEPSFGFYFGAPRTQFFFGFDRDRRYQRYDRSPRYRHYRDGYRSHYRDRDGERLRYRGHERPPIGH